MPISKTYEKMGLFYLGRELDLNGQPAGDAPFLYPSRNLTTHGVILGMTGSGKTGMGIGLIEEAVMDEIPSIIIDPKGDMGNLLLTFPQCRAGDFEPWIDPAEAARKGLDLPEFAKKTAEEWKQGLARWGQGPDRIEAMRSKSAMTIYTPGSSAGTPVCVLADFQAPSRETIDDVDSLNDLVESCVSSLLSLVAIEGEPLQSREHILISSLLLYYWRRGESPSLESLIGGIVAPPFEKVGVFPMNSFYPQAERMTLAMALNNVLASPSFYAWIQGAPMDIQRILYGDDGKPKTAIFSISHLNDNERMFFVTMLLNSVVSWMRRQQGASTLKALLYMDEIFGFFPPSANPPSKKPMMLLLKQARAFGLGVVLSTQNPVDLDYKGLSNIGTWIVGRLQTKQDQDRVVEGIVSASNGRLKIGETRRLLANLKERQFLVNAIHLDETILFETRWVMSYLKGPISSRDIENLTNERAMSGFGPEAVVSPPGPSSSGRKQTSRVADTMAPVISRDIEQRFHLPNAIDPNPVFEPWLAVSVSVRFFNEKRNIDQESKICRRLYLDEQWYDADWESLESMDFDIADCGITAPGSSQFYPLPQTIVQMKNLRALQKEFIDHLYHNQRLELFRVNKLTFESEPRESLADFKIRLRDHLREEKQRAVEALRKKFAKEQERLEDRLTQALAGVEKEKQDVQAKTADTLITFGTAVLGAFFGKKTFSATNIQRAASGVKGVGRITKEKSDVRRAEDRVAALQTDIDALALEIEQESEKLTEKFSIDNYEVETFSIKPRRSDIFDVEIALLWDVAD